MKNGFTLIELLLVIAIVGVLGATSTPFLSSFLVRNNWYVATDRVVSEVNKAQGYATSGKVISGNTVWGVCILGNVFRMFNGSCATPNYNEDYAFPAGVVLSGISSVTFDNLRGEPSTVSTINVVSTYGSSSVALTASGMIDAN